MSILIMRIGKRFLYASECYLFTVTKSELCLPPAPMLIFLIDICICLFFVKIFLIASAGRCKSYVCLVGKTAIVTGGTSGIGLETALKLASRGCKVIIANQKSAEHIRKSMVEETGNENIVRKHLNLASLKSVREFADDILQNESRLDILINNAGCIGFNKEMTSDGLLKAMQINHFGPFLLTHLLIDILKKTPNSRIIFVSSNLAYFHKLKPEKLNSPPDISNELYHSITAYANSKLCNIITANMFAAKLKPLGITCNSLHPGCVRTSILKYINNDPNRRSTAVAFLLLLLQKFSILAAKTAFDGAETSLYCAISKDVENITGEYFIDCRKFWQPNCARHPEYSNKVWAISAELVGLSQNQNS